MRMSEAYPSTWLTADELDDDADLVVTIRDIEPATYEEFKQQGKATPDRKPVLHFKSPKGTKPLILNKTNYKAISEVLGTDDTEEWGGESVALYKTEVEVGGETKMGIRIRLRKPRTTAPSNTVKSVRRAQPQVEEEIGDGPVNF